MLRQHQFLPEPRTLKLLVCFLVASTSALAQQRPSEEELFGRGAPDAGQPVQQPPTAPSFRPSENELFGRPAADSGTPGSEAQSNPKATTDESTRDERALSEPPTRDLFASEPGRDNPLQIGGQIYLRSIVQLSEGVSLDKARSLLPAIVDGYFDARPSDRVRGMILGRLTYDPTLVENAPNATNAGFGSGSTSGLGSVTLPTASNPGVLLDQLWVNFDIARTVFVTAGRQHVKWGVSRFWNPTDFLTPQRRDPLAVFDPRLGASMVKFHLPSEAHGWNLYAIGLFDNAGPASTLGQIGGAFRGEIAFGRSEVGAEVVLQQGRRARFGFDASSAIGPLDGYAEVSLRSATDAFLWRLAADPAAGFTGQFEQYRATGVAVGASGGLNHTFIFGDRNKLTVGGEYFYNSVGYHDPALYPWLLQQGAFQPFYVGKHYGALFASFTSPALGEKTTLLLSNLSNLSDSRGGDPVGSVITRVDFLNRVLTYLYLEAYADVHWGRRGGEFRLEINLPPLYVPPPLFDVGVGVRIKI